jgi:undecaprenyl-diphosphatase
MNTVGRLSTRIRQIWSWICEREPVVLLSLFLVTAGVWGFIFTADHVLEGDTEAFDTWAVRAMRRSDDPATPIGPAWLHEIGRDATAFGGVAGLTFFTLVAAGFLYLNGKRAMVWLLLASTGGGLVLSSLLKEWFNRPRPEIVPHLSYVYTSSFPSGHSMLSAVVYLTLGSLLAASVTQRRLKAYILFVAILLTVLVGVSRVYLGVHYPTDVLAGWMAGLAWSLLVWLIARWLQSGGRVQQEPANPTARAN